VPDYECHLQPAGLRPVVVQRCNLTLPYLNCTDGLMIAVLVSCRGSGGSFSREGS